MYLLDVNVLIALAWPNNTFHDRAIAWFKQSRSSGFATCLLTQLGFLRLSMNEDVTLAKITYAEAANLLRSTLELPGHVFLPELPSVIEALSQRPPRSYRQTTDAYLIALAAHHGGAVATFDRALYESAGHAGPAFLIQ